jgi:hypothetical protein
VINLQNQEVQVAAAYLAAKVMNKNPSKKAVKKK